MKTELRNIPVSELVRVTDQAIAEGRHSVVRKYFCTRCRQMKDSIFYSFQKVELCVECADEIGQGPKAFDERRERFNLAEQARIEAARHDRHVTHNRW